MKASDVSCPTCGVRSDEPCENAEGKLLHIPGGVHARRHAYAASVADSPLITALTHRPCAVCDMSIVDGEWYHDHLTYFSLPAHERCVDGRMRET